MPLKPPATPRWARYGTFASSSNLIAPTGLAFDTSGNLYVANLASHGSTIEKFSPTGQDLGIFIHSGINAPEGIAFNQSGLLYVSNYNGSYIEKFSSTGQDLGSFANLSQGHPRGIRFDNSGDLYVAAESTIEKYGPTGTHLATIATGLDQCYDFAIGPDGNIYAAVDGSNLIEEYSPTGTDLGEFATMFHPTGIDFDDDGNLYVSDPVFDEIRKFAPDGTDLGQLANTYPTTPGLLIVGPVPEPTGSVLIFTGGLILFAISLPHKFFWCHPKCHLKWFKLT